MTLEQFMQEYGYIYKFLGLGNNINSQFITVGLQESFKGRWQDALEMRSPDTEGMINYHDGYYFCSNPEQFNPNSCDYWKNAKLIFEALGFNITNVGDIFFTEPDPFARPSNRTSIPEFYDITGENTDNLPANIEAFTDRINTLTTILTESHKIVFFAKGKKTPLDSFSELIDINIGIYYTNKFGDYRYGKLHGGNIFFECPHFSYIAEELNEFTPYLLEKYLSLTVI